MPCPSNVRACRRRTLHGALGQLLLELESEGEDLLIMKESDILGVLEGVAAKRKAA